MLQKKTIFPVTRIHNPMLLEAWLENGEIKDAYISDTLYRGFEQILIGRSAMDMPYYTQRICGICSSAHAITAALAVEQALGMQVPPNGLLIRNLILASDFIQNHIRHLYLYTMPDYFRGPDLAPFIPHSESDLRLTSQENTIMTEHYFKALEISRDAHAAFAVFGGKAPHGHGIVPGGASMEVDADKVNRYRGYMMMILGFIDDVLLPDVTLIMERYPEYIDLGKGIGNYLSVGGFPSPEGSTLYPQGVILQGKRESFSEKHVTEDVTYAWYKPHGPLHPMEEDTVPDRSQAKGYTWVKSPRYRGQPVEVGPLARAIINKEEVLGHGALGRTWARAIELKKIAVTTLEWLNRLEPGAETLDRKMGQDSGVGIGLHEAMRGALGHWILVENMRVKHYQIVTPSALNFGARDETGTPSVGETSILGLKIQSEDLKEAGRVIRSFDPCFSCSVHIIDGEKIRALEIPV
ncbi:nickel-dependent hydrogenase large subunit [Desulfosporosinus sp.]|uniref:nickel-dependent hydrogenase large subunit n=1 Tax=Desulfosporosinus sp. TaxID=157907 RepID=UPI000E817110|nr:nickel-dependent hydrogenase large subunit [Desulfosporosinus sp.]MBC2721227.1 nickel-dependent hydrogenase large subunit [Desulfosporosinus sp.]MBC2728659.1 nickel-dependent hydrogenase large subunit [Desulfosporosinus sp.]HBV88487.1 Hup-type Ni,Fe-hydrogenase large subunit [Desulfosporosinus sp.]